jgi:hypothetical protein
MSHANAPSTPAGRLRLVRRPQAPECPGVAGQAPPRAAALHPDQRELAEHGDPLRDHHPLTDPPRHLRQRQRPRDHHGTYIDAWNERAHPFTWIENADEIISHVKPSPHKKEDVQPATPAGSVEGLAGPRPSGVAFRPVPAISVRVSRPSPTCAEAGRLPAPDRVQPEALRQWNGASRIRNSTTATPVALRMYQGQGPSTDSNETRSGIATRNM